MTSNYLVRKTHVESLRTICSLRSRDNMQFGFPTWMTGNYGNYDTICLLSIWRSSIFTFWPFPWQTSYCNSHTSSSMLDDLDIVLRESFACKAHISTQARYQGQLGSRCMTWHDMTWMILHNFLPIVHPIGRIRDDPELQPRHPKFPRVWRRCRASL